MTRRRGRPPKYGPEIHKQICDSLALGMSRTTAAELAGIDRGTLNEWAGMPPEWDGKYPAFSNDVRLAIAKAKRRATVTITNAIQKGDVAAAFRYLALQERHEWQETKQVDIRVQIEDAAKKVADETGLSIEEVLAEAEAIMRGVA